MVLIFERSVRELLNTNDDDSPTLRATGITARGENGSSSNWGFRMSDGLVQLGSSQLWGGAYREAGTLTCFGVYDESFTSYSCP